MRRNNLRLVPLTVLTVVVLGLILAAMPLGGAPLLGTASASAAQLPEFDLLGTSGTSATNETVISSMNMSTGEFSGTAVVDGIDFTVSGSESADIESSTLSEVGASYQSYNTFQWSIGAGGELTGSGSFHDTYGNTGTYTAELNSPAATIKSTTKVSCAASGGSGDSYKCTATVTGSGGTPTGNATFSDNGAGGSFPDGPACALSKGSCTVTYMAPSGSSSAPPVEGVYSGNGTFEPSEGSSGSGAGGGSTGTGSSATIVNCDAYYPGTPLETFQCTVSVAPGAGGGQLPTGKVKLSSTSGGFPQGDVCTLTPATAAAICTVNFDPGDGSALTITADYTGDKTFAKSTGQLQLQPDLGSTPNQAFQLQVCAAFYTGACSGLLPAPDPVQTCVAMVQTCNGFGGSNPSTVIPLGGDPSQLVTQTGCDQSATNPYQTGAKPQTGGSPDCIVDATVEANDDPDPTVDPAQQYQSNLRRFQAAVTAAQASFYAGLASFNWAALYGTTADAIALFKPEVDPLFQAEAEAGTDGPAPPTPPDQKDCTSRYDGAARTYCIQVLSAVFNNLSGILYSLGIQKEQLGLDQPFSQPAPEISRRLADDPVASAAAGRVKARHRYRFRAIVIASGRAKVHEGRHGALHLRLTESARKILEAARRHGARRVTGVLVITAIHGHRMTTRRIKVRLALTRR